MASLASLARKVLFFPLTRMIIAIVAVVAGYVLVMALGLWLARRYGLGGRAWFAALRDVLVAATVSLIYCGYVRLLERRAVTELAPGPAAREFALGAAVGFGLLTATIASLWILGYYHVEGIGRLPSAALLTSMGLLPAFFEEILMRGIVFRITEESLGTWLALLISGLLFGDLHLLNPGATWAAAIFIAVEAGILLAAAYIVTRRLWVPIGMHAAWNVTLGGIFGVPVSGLQVDGMLKGALSGPELLSGGAFGPEASVFTVLVCTSMSVYLMVRAVKSGQIMRPFWSRGKTELITEVAAGEHVEVVAQSDPRAPAEWPES